MSDGVRSEPGDLDVDPTRALAQARLWRPRQATRHRQVCSCPTSLSLSRSLQDIARRNIEIATMHGQMESNHARLSAATRDTQRKITDQQKTMAEQQTFMDRDRAKLDQVQLQLTQEERRLRTLLKKVSELERAALAKVQGEFLVRSSLLHYS